MHNDLRYALQMLLKSPGFTAVAVITLGLGIGANTTIFSLVNALFYRPLPVRQPYRLVNVYSNENGRGYKGFAYPEYSYLRDHSTSLEALAAHYSTAPLNVVADGDSKEVDGAVVSANYFSMLRIRPLLGRFFLPEEDAVPGRNPVAVIGFSLWQGRFRGDPLILGKKIRINGTVFEVIGVAPEGFHGVLVGGANELWIPAMMLRLGYRWCDGFSFDCRVLDIIGRLAPGRKLTDAQAELETLAAQLATAFPATNKGRGVSLLPAIGLQITTRSEFRDQTQLLVVVANALLLMACTNLAGLLLARSLGRSKEIAVRLAIGATRRRLIRQLLTESLVLALMGGALALVLSFWAKDLLLGFYATDSEGYRHFYDLSLDRFVLAYSLALSVFTGLLFGLVPAIQSTRPDLAMTMKDGGGVGRLPGSKLRGVLVIGQVALSLALLVSAGLLVRSAARVEAGHNLDPHHVVLLRLRPRLVGYAPEKAQAFHQEVVRRLEALPGVQSVSLGRGIGAIWSNTGEVSVRLPGQVRNPKSDFNVSYHEIAPQYFETLKIRLIQGRDFNTGDQPGSPRVAIVNESLARHLWPEGSPLDRVLIVNDQPYQVVGLSKDCAFRNALEPPPPFLYIPYWQSNIEPQIDSRMCVRVAGDPWAMLPPIRREIAAVDPGVPISEDMPMTEQLNAHYMSVFLARSVLACSGAMALFLSAIGLYAILAFAVSQRTREIGIRIALGAVPKDVVILLLRQGVSLVLAGTAIGLLIALATTRLLSSWLYGVRARDPMIFVCGAVLLIGVALLACCLPARRATKVDPIVALRYE
jgi:predicted permease